MDFDVIFIPLQFLSSDYLKQNEHKKNQFIEKKNRESERKVRQSDF